MSRQKIISHLSFLGDAFIFFLCFFAIRIKNFDLSAFYPLATFFIYILTLKISASSIDYVKENLKSLTDYYLKLFFAMLLSGLIIVSYVDEPSLSIILFILLTCLSLVFSRLVASVYFSKIGAKSMGKKPIIIVGAGEATKLLVKELVYQGGLGNIAGLVDDDPKKQGLSIETLPVLGTISDLGRLAKEYDAGELILSIENLTSEIVNKTLDQIDPRKIMLRIIPTEREVLLKSLSFSQTRTISPEDLLGRPSKNLDDEAVKNYFNNKSILITGAGGSIGSELAQQLSYFPVKNIICVSRGEYSLYALQRQMSKSNVLNIPLVYLLGNVQDSGSMDKIIVDYKPDVIFHAAAYKHVPMLEHQEQEAIKNNVYGTHNLLELSQKRAIKNFILISTDKAVNPKSIMGASKRMAEMLCEYYYHQKKLPVAVVRFGNVIGSRGSVVPLFEEQISSGGPVTVTHPDVTRYFMTIAEAAQLVLTAATFSKKGEKFILDMGRAIRIDDLVKKMIRLSGFEPGKDIKIKYTGLRPGEKLVEELSAQKENLETTANKKIFVSKDAVRESVCRTYEEIVNLMAKVDGLSSEDIRKSVKSIIEEFDERAN